MKKKLLIVIAVVLIAVVAAVGLTACVDLAGMSPDEIKEYGTLVIATNAEFRMSGNIKSWLSKSVFCKLIHAHRSRLRQK